MAEDLESDRELKDDLVMILQIALLFCALLVGRELGNIYSNYGEVSKLSVNFQVSEEELAGFIRGVIMGNDSDLATGMTFTLSSFRSVEGPVTQVPDYVRRWFISLTLSAVTVQQPEVSDVEVQLLIEGEPIQTEVLSFSREKVSYMRLLNRTISLHVDDTARFRGVIQEASERHGGEVEATLRGRALAHVAFLDVWLPFSTTRYPLVKAPHVDYQYSSWTDTSGGAVNSMRIDGMVYISVHIKNPTRVHSIFENVTATIYRVGSDAPVYKMSRILGVASGTEATYFFPFTPEGPGTYYYTLATIGGFSVGGGQSSKLEVKIR